MKDPLRIQKKLFRLTRGKSGLSIGDQQPPWSEREFSEKAWVVRDYVENSGEVINDDPLQEWLEEYHFFCNS